MADKDVLGRAGEDLAAKYLIEQGMRLLERNWRCGEGEIDIVCADGAEIVVVEVKTRSSEAFGSPLLAVDMAKQQRLWRLAKAWCAANRDTISRREIRIDLIGIVMNAGVLSRIDHLRDIR